MSEAPPQPWNSSETGDVCALAEQSSRPHTPEPQPSPSGDEEKVEQITAAGNPFDDAVHANPFDADIAVVRVGEDVVQVDLNACAPMAAVFSTIRRRRLGGEDAEGEAATTGTSESTGAQAGGPSGEPDLTLDNFPGGVDLLKNLVRYLTVAAGEERAASAVAGELGMPAGVLKVDPSAFHLEFTTENISKYLEAAATLQCPRLLRETVLSPAAKELSSRRVFSCLERILQFTANLPASEGTLPAFADSAGQGSSSTPSASFREVAVPDDEAGYCSRKQVVQAFSQVIQRLCARLDTVDFKLTATLATGSPWASLEVLRAYRIKVENVGRVNYALQSMKSTVTSFFYEEEKSSTQQTKQDWKEHHFALHVFRKQIVESMLYAPNSETREAAEKAMAPQANEVTRSDDEGDESRAKATERADDDIPEALADEAPGEALACLAGLVVYCDPMQTPPVLAAAMVRSLLIVGENEHARSLFEAVFVRSRKAQAMVVAGIIPVDFLCSVKAHRISSVVLRRLLSRYESLPRNELCHLLDGVLLEDFRYEQHCHELILSNALAEELVVYCRVSTQAAAEVADQEDLSGEPSMVDPGTGDTADRVQLRKVGEKLFAAVFVIHNGFLPQTEPVPSDRRNRGEAECAWDTGNLDLPLLRHVAQHEDALQLARRVLLRGLSRRERSGVESDVAYIVQLWSLGRWPACGDEALISEAFHLLSGCWRELRATEAQKSWQSWDSAALGRLIAEESLFKMFSDLEFWRLQPRDLMTPWVPPQLFACHIASKCKVLYEQQQNLANDNRSNLEEINRLRQTVTQLLAKLEAVDARSIQSVQKQAEVADTLRTLRR